MGGFRAGKRQDLPCICDRSTPTAQWGTEHVGAEVEAGKPPRGETGGLAQRSGSGEGDSNGIPVLSGLGHARQVLCHLASLEHFKGGVWDGSHVEVSGGRPNVQGLRPVPRRACPHPALSLSPVPALQSPVSLWFLSRGTCHLLHTCLSSPSIG